MCACMCLSGGIIPTPVASLVLGLGMPTSYIISFGKKAARTQKNQIAIQINHKDDQLNEALSWPITPDWWTRWKCRWQCCWKWKKSIEKESAKLYRLMWSGAPPRLPSRTRSYPSKPVVKIKASQQPKECQKKLHKQTRWNAIPNGKRKDSSISPVQRTGSLTFVLKQFPTLGKDLKPNICHDAGVYGSHRQL